MAFKAFISETFLKENTYISKNVDMTLLRPAIRVAQEKYILPLLGTALYNKIATDIPNSVTGTYKTLLDDYIIPCLMWYVVGECTIPMSYRFNNKSLMRNTGDNEIPLDKDEIFGNMEYAQQNAEWYAERMIDYLCTIATTSVLPEYLSPGTTSDTIHPRKHSFTAPIFISGMRRQGSALSKKRGYIPISLPDDWMQWI